jgi:hypothetical protein
VLLISRNSGSIANFPTKQQLFIQAPKFEKLF